MQAPPAARPGGSVPSLITDLDETNIVEALVNVVGRYAPLAIDLQVEVAADQTLIVAGAPAEWESALCDLLDNALADNALAESSAGVPVQVRLSANDGEALISVRDSGPGIRADEFAIYYQRTALDGVRRVLQQGGGKIAITSGGARAGTRIDVTILDAETRPGTGQRFLA